MKSAFLPSLVVTLLFGHTAHADVTMRSKLDYKLASFLPPAAAEAMNKQLGETVANGVVVRIKGQRAMANSGALQVITDREKGTVTLLDPKGKRYATCALAEYGEKLKSLMPNMPPEARQMFENMKIDVKSDKTGNSDTIRNIKAEETLVTITLDVPGPMAAMMAMRVEMHLWTAAAQELERLPALREVAAYTAQQLASSDSASGMAKMFAQIPGFADKLKPLLEQMMKGTSQAVLRTQMKMIMPGSAKMMGAANPEEPFTEMTTDLVELSTDTIPDSVFGVPSDYKDAPVEELLQMMNPLRQQSQPQPK
ncbi:MAG TPA: hypothetical protein VMJ75_00990 [Candidatus Acidoferrales bacterium]|nr:hypothetical protein [Candidatus Acidoferrales bacterium]